MSERMRSRDDAQACDRGAGRWCVGGNELGARRRTAATQRRSSNRLRPAAWASMRRRSRSAWRSIIRPTTRCTWRLRLRQERARRVRPLRFRSSGANRPGISHGGHGGDAGELGSAGPRALTSRRGATRFPTSEARNADSLLAMRLLPSKDGARERIACAPGQEAFGRLAMPSKRAQQPRKLLRKAMAIFGRGSGQTRTGRRVPASRVKRKFEV